MYSIFKILPKIFALAILGLALTKSITVFAQGVDLDPNEIRGTSTKKPVAVLQNRFFLKALRPEVGILFGTILNESYTKTTLTGIRIGGFLNEWVGGEFQYIKGIVKDSDDRKALNDLRYRKLDDVEKTVSPDPELNPITGIKEAAFIAAPFYGKLSLLDWAIVYTDFYGSLGIASVTTDQGNKAAISFGGGVRTYWAKKWSTRLDFRDRTFSETRSGRDTRKHAWAVDFGLSYFIL
ncbi:MAG: outer membrane beta-barrel domain-containing protein [Proteobacteria bacterium]|nr:outer membrane beta-barrel domain-containing protein [Pseudomonadota bacterium]